MAIGQAFNPNGNTLLVALTSAASGAARASTGAFQAYELSNLSTANLFVGMSASSGVAPVLPLSSAASTATPGFFIRGNETKVRMGPPNAYFSAMTTGAAIAGMLAITAGEGKA